jgi:hypothetical protein
MAMTIVVLLILSVVLLVAWRRAAAEETEAPLPRSAVPLCLGEPTPVNALDPVYRAIYRSSGEMCLELEGVNYGTCPGEGRPSDDDVWVYDRFRRCWERP